MIFKNKIPKEDGCYWACRKWQFYRKPFIVELFTVHDFFNYNCKKRYINIGGKHNYLVGSEDYKDNFFMYGEKVEIPEIEVGKSRKAKK